MNGYIGSKPLVLCIEFVLYNILPGRKVNQAKSVAVV